MVFFTKNRIKNWCVSAVVILVIVLSFYISDTLSVEFLQEHKDRFKGIALANYYLSATIFVFLGILFMNSPLPLAAGFKIAGGLIFGVFYGGIINVIGTLFGCQIGFLATRKLYRKRMEEKYGKRFAKIKNHIEKNEFNYFLISRAIFVVPFFLINIFGGLSRISSWKFFWSTALPIIPSAFVYAYAGSKIDELSNFSDIYSLEIILLFALIALLSFSSTFLKYFKVRYKKPF